MFAPRTGGHAERVQDHARDALLKPGEHLVIWGFTGVGKTSLFIYLANKLKLPYLSVTAKPPLDNRTAAEVIIENALTELGYERALEARRSSETSGHVEIRAPKVRAGIGVKDSAAVISAIQSNTLDRALVKALAASHYRLLFIDGLEFVPENERERTVAILGGLMHELSDMASSDPKTPTIVVAGVAEAADQLVPTGGPVARRVYQLRVPRMSHDELRHILQRGADLLGLRFTQRAEDAIINVSDGFPFYAHHFAYYAVEQARRRQLGRRVDIVAYHDYVQSLDAAIDGAELRLTRPYMSAIEPSNTNQVRKRVLEALAQVESFTAPIEEIRRAYIALFPNDRDALRAGFFRTPLSELVSNYALVKMVRAQDASGGYVYSFRDPLMRAYVRLHREHPQLTDFTRGDLLVA